tara:strand:- start:7028 stop:9394 length:2367 start_codon:yes stop_codon:yes gene_type:complete
MANTVETFSQKIISILTGDTVNPGAANYYLEALYGTWITGNDGTYTLVTSTFSIINLLAFALSVIIFFAAFVGGISKTALTGEVMGKNWGQDLLPVKMFIGVVMMMPILVDNHVSLSQRMGMNLLLMGSAAGDYTWRKAVDDAYMNIGSNTAPSSFVYNARNIVKSSVCAAALVNGRGASDQPLLTITKVGRSRARRKTFYPGNNIKEYKYNNYSSYFYARDRDGDSAETQEQLRSLFNTREPGIKKIEFGKKGECGSISFAKLIDNKIDDSDVSSFTEKVRLLEYKIAKSNYETTLEFVVASIGYGFNAIKLGYDKFEEADNHDASMQTKLAVDNLRKAVEKSQDKYVYDSEKNIGSEIKANKKYTKNILDEAKEAGWIYAGAWIMQLGRITKIVPTAVSISMSSTYSSPTAVCENLFSANDDDCGMAQDIKIIPHSLTNFEGSSDANFGRVTAAIDSCSHEKCGNNEIKDSLSAYVASGILRILQWGGQANYNYNLYEGDGDKIIGISADEAREYSEQFGIVSSTNPIKDASGLANPFATLIQLGHGFLNFSYIVEISMILPAMNAEKIASSLSKIPVIGTIFGKWVESVLELLIFKLFAVYTAFLAIGVMLAYLLPVLPVVRWLGPALGFLIVSLEFHAVAPLAMMLLLIPEGSGIVGTQLMSVIRYLAAVLLRPTLIIMGLVGGYVASYVVFGLFNGLFWKGFGLSTGSSIFEIIITVYLYAYIGYQILDKIYALSINLVRDILRWISPGNEPFGDAAFGQINVEPNTLSNMASFGVIEKKMKQ